MNPKRPDVKEVNERIKSRESSWRNQYDIIEDLRSRGVPVPPVATRLLETRLNELVGPVMEWEEKTGRIYDGLPY